METTDMSMDMQWFDELKGVCNTFEEKLAHIMERSNDMCIPMEEHLEGGLIIDSEINPMENYPDDFLDILRREMDMNGVRVLALDSMRG